MSASTSCRLSTTRTHRACISSVGSNRSGKGLVEAGLVQGLIAKDGRAGFMMEVEPGDAEAYAAVRDQAEAALRALPGVERAQVVLTADRAPASTSPRPDLGSRMAFRAARAALRSTGWLKRAPRWRGEFEVRAEIGAGAVRTSNS